MTLEIAKNSLNKALEELEQYKWFFLNCPNKDFSRNRKLSFSQIVKALLCMGGGTFSYEMINFFRIKGNALSEES